MNSIEWHLKQATQALKNSGSDTPSLDAAVLMCHILDKPRSYLLTWPERELTIEQQHKFDALIQQRIEGKPVAYLVGEREFLVSVIRGVTLNLDPTRGY